MLKLHNAFLEEYSPETFHALDGNELGDEIRAAFGVAAPSTLIDFWDHVGVGYFSDRELLFFGGEHTETSKRTLIEWNRLPDWGGLLVSPANGGPIFFGETCFGDQMGFRYDIDGECKAVLFALDTCELFVMTPNFDDLFQHLLDDPHTVADPQQLSTLRTQIGPLPSDNHYAPIVPILLGGSSEPHNFHIEPATVHVKTVIATWTSLPED